MPTNLLKHYSDLLEIMHLSEAQRNNSLRGVFDRDIQDNSSLKFQTKTIRPIKIEGQPTMDTLFNHLTKEIQEETDASGKLIKKRVFEKDRSIRLHWVRFHIEEKKKNNVEVFSIVERDPIKRVDVTRTYIYDQEMEYVIVLEPQNSGQDYYLLTAFYLNQSWAPKAMRKKLKNKLPSIY